MRADPQIDRTAVRVGTSDTRQIAESERASCRKVRGAEALRGVREIAMFEREAEGGQQPLRVGLCGLHSSARARRSDRRANLLGQDSRPIDFGKASRLVVCLDDRAVHLPLPVGSRGGATAGCQVRLERFQCAVSCEPQNDEVDERDTAAERDGPAPLEAEMRVGLLREERDQRQCNSGNERIVAAGDVTLGHAQSERRQRETSGFRPQQDANGATPALRRAPKAHAYHRLTGQHGGDGGDICTKTHQGARDCGRVTRHTGAVKSPLQACSQNSPQAEQIIMRSSPQRVETTHHDRAVVCLCSTQPFIIIVSKN